MRFIILFIFSCFLVLFSSVTAYGQDIKPLTISLDSLNKLNELKQQAALDSVDLEESDTVNRPVASGDFTDIVTYSATDSIKYDFKTQKIILYTKSEIDYTNINLKSDNITLDWNTNELTAIGLKDSLGGLTETPIFKQGDDEYKAKKIRYNFVSEKAIVTDIVKKEGEGFLLLEKGKRDAEGNFNGIEGSYTTCTNTAHPHFRIRSKKLKVIENKQIITGPFQLELMDIPTPVGFPFGLLPIPKTRSSGIIIPSYGETQERGFFLRDGGYYWAISDHIDLTFLGEAYSKGVYGASVRSRYSKRYYYTGNFDFRMNTVRAQERGIDESSNNDFRLTWSHNPKSRGSSSFSANVNIMTSQFNERNSFNPNDYTQASVNSGINYNKTFTGTPFVFSGSIRHDQNLQTKITNVSPQANLSMNRIFPLRKMVKNSQSPLAQLGFSYRLDGQAKLSNLLTNSITGSFKVPSDQRLASDTVAFDVDNLPTILDNVKWGLKHSVPLSTSVTFLRYFKMNPSANFSQVIYGSSNSYEWVEKDTVRTTVNQGLSQFYSYNASVDFTTTFYSTFLFKSPKFKALRHTMIPTISLSYQPDFSDPRFGFYQEVQISEDGRTQRIPRMSGLYGSPAAGESGTISFSLRNTLEAKVETKEGKDEKRKLLDSFDFSSAYNLAADSFNLGNININLRTSLFKNKIGINVRGAIDPYRYEALTRDTLTNLVLTQRKINTYAWQEGASIGTLSTVAISLNTSLSADGFKSDNEEEASSQAISEADLNFINQNRNLYVDFDVPWTVSVSYNWNYSRTGLIEGSASQNLSLNGDVNVTPKWKVGYNASYDLELNEFSDATFNIHRDLHCWELRVSWTPVGFRRGYSLDLRVKSSLLQDLKLNRRNNWRDRR
ncbi:putative LPS assembly protein LptD [Bernardetia sp. ABR2-2B]|uniref:putative LPS assembly protein LptD n=1 Tax=Bernardetia sp. ABR2-2B TaxID=3127472 RepID=UPI0030CB9A35